MVKIQKTKKRSAKEELFIKVGNVGVFAFILALLNIVAVPIIYSIFYVGDNILIFIIIDLLFILPIFITSILLIFFRTEDLKKTKSRLTFLFYYTIIYFIGSVIAGSFPWVFIFLIYQIYKTNNLLVEKPKK